MISSPKILPTRKMINAHCADPDITSRHARERVRSDIETAVTCDVFHTRVAFIEGATRRANEALEFLFSGGCRVRRGGGENKFGCGIDWSSSIKTQFQT